MMAENGFIIPVFFVLQLSSTDIAFVGSLNDKINDILEKKRVVGNQSFF